MLIIIVSRLCFLVFAWLIGAYAACQVDLIQNGGSTAMDENSFIFYSGFGRWECLPRKQFLYDPLVREFQLSVMPQCQNEYGCYTVRCIHVANNLEPGRYVFIVHTSAVSGSGGTARAYSSFHGQNVVVEEVALASSGEHVLKFDFSREKKPSKT